MPLKDLTVAARLVPAIASSVSAKQIVPSATRDMPCQALTRVGHARHARAASAADRLALMVTSIAATIAALRVRADTSQKLMVLALRVMQTMVKDVARHVPMSVTLAVASVQGIGGLVHQSTAVSLRRSLYERACADCIGC
jgi:hypothetical protein